jgi:hypothetical protein
MVSQHVWPGWLALATVVGMGALGCAASEMSGGADAGRDGPSSGTPDGAGDSGAGTGGIGAGGSGGGDGSGGNGSGTDAAPAETGAEAPLSNCRLQGLELCEDFESGALDPKVWGMHTTAGSSITVDQEHAHGGAYALHVKLVAGQANVAQITDAVTFPAKDNTFYTRAFIYVSPDLPADNAGGFHMAYLLATGNNDLGYVEAGLGTAGNKQYVGYSEYYGAGPNVHAHGPSFYEFGPDSQTRLVPQQWICLELLQGGNATTTTRRVWINDKELPEQLSNYSGRKPPQFDMVSIGILQYHPTPILTDVWFDDIRVSSTKIGCN